MASQLPLPGISPPDRVVNVASVLHRSPFRYPGGKTWLVPRIRRWLASQSNRPTELIEPFAGGGIVGLTAAFEQLADRVTLVELDEDVAAVWQTILSEHGAWLADQIAGFDLTPENVKQLLEQPDLSVRQQALRTIVKNRVNRGGILAPGAGMLKYGEKGKGIASRWYPGTLQKRIYDIVAIRERITFIHDDGLEIIRQNAERGDVVWFIDPPYTAGGKKAGRRLYTHFDVDHEVLFKLTGELAGDFLMTFDNAEEVRELALQHDFDMQPVSMKNTHHAKMTELLIGRDLDWLR